MDAKRRRTVTPKQLKAIRLSAFGQKETVALLLDTIEELWRREADSATKEPEQQVEIEKAEHDFDSQEKVLCVLDFRGQLEVYAEKWVSVKVLELTPWEEKEEAIERLAARYFGPYWTEKLRERGGLNVCHKIEDALEWFCRAEAWRKYQETKAVTT